MSDAAPFPFTCRQCGACCRAPGTVRLKAGEAAAIAALLGIGEEAFTARWTRLMDHRRALSLTEQPDGACCFLTADSRCLIQQAKPRQCRDYPHHWRTADLDKHCAARRQTGPVSADAH